MNSHDFQSQSALDQVLDEIRDEPVDNAVVEVAAARAWSQISGAAQPRLVEKIRSCEDFQALLADYRAGRLSEARRLLVEDHTHECVACRRALAGRPKVTEFPAPLRREAPVTYRWAVAAAVVAGVGLTTWGVWYYVSGPSGSPTTVAVVNGTLYRISSAGNAIVKAGEILPAGAEIRTAKDSGAVIRLHDGSLVELSERSGFSVSEAGRDLTVNLGLGSIIVQAARRHSGHLFVATRDCKVAVTGTVFSVNSGVKGSRVAVIEGEVHVTRDQTENVLHPGDEYTSTAALQKIPVKDEIAWSRNFDQHMALLKEIQNLQNKLEQIHFPDNRYSSRLMAYAPASTALYVSIPNLGKTLAEAQQVMRTHVLENPELARWWAGMAKDGFSPDTVVDKMREFSDYLGDEIVVAAPFENGSLGKPVIYAELKRPGVGEYIQHLVHSLGGSTGDVHITDDPAKATGNAPWILVRSDLLAIAPDARALHLGDGGFASTPFGAQVADAYRNGAGILFTMDLQAMLRNSQPPDMPVRLADLRSLLLEQKEEGGLPRMRATVSFRGERKGLFSWLAAPAPMRALDFISPEAGFVAAFTMKNPGQVLEELKANRTIRIDEVADLAAPLGGEFAVAMDGPLMPPAWKLVVEVYDAPRLENAIEKLVETENRQCGGKENCTVTLTAETVNGRVYHALTIPGVPFGEAQYTFVDGYLLAATNRQLLDRAMQYRATGYTLPRSAQFMQLVPRDHYSNFSAMVYQNLGPQLAPLANLLGGTRKNLGDLAANLKPMMMTAYGEPDRITVAAGGSLMGLSLNNLIQGNLMGAVHGLGWPGAQQRTPRDLHAYHQ